MHRPWQQQWGLQWKLSSVLWEGKTRCPLRTTIWCTDRRRLSQIWEECSPWELSEKHISYFSNCQRTKCFDVFPRLNSQVSNSWVLLQHSSAENTQGRFKVFAGPRQNGTWGPLTLFKLLGRDPLKSDFDSSVNALFSHWILGGFASPSI